MKKGWAGRGYYFFIRIDGFIYKGREINVVGVYGKGHNIGYIGVSGVDGYFGKDTERAVSEFQKDRKIQVDGVVGSVSWERIFKK